jgi:hypothetical protein
MRWRRTNREPEHRENLDLKLVAECEEFLKGRLAEQWAKEDRHVPAWAWINVLAHGSASRLETLRDGELGALRAGEPSWNQALSFLASAVIGAAQAAGCRIDKLQHDVLVPLELELLTSTAPSPHELVDVVVGTLNEYRS